jgi:hypothetical protein
MARRFNILKVYAFSQTGDNYRYTNPFVSYAYLRSHLFHNVNDYLALYHAKVVFMFSPAERRVQDATPNNAALSAPYPTVQYSLPPNFN